MAWLKKQSRKWHTWLGVVFAIPLCIVGITTLFMAHEKSINLGKYWISTSFFPGYHGETMLRNEIRSYFKDDKGVEYFGSKMGLLIQKEGIVSSVPFFETHEVRGIEMLGGHLLVGTRKALFFEQEGLFKEVLKKDIWDLSVRDGVVSVVVNKDGLLSSHDLKIWKPMDIPADAQTLNRVTLKKLNQDLHTGRALLGEQAMWIWQDILACCVLFFIGTGVYLWYSKKHKKVVKGVQ